MAAVARNAPQVNGVRKPPVPKAPTKKPQNAANAARKTPNGAARVPQHVQRGAQPVQNKAASIAGDNPVTGVTSAYALVASRIANRVAEMAETITFVEKPRAKEPEPEDKRKPRKLEMRLNNGAQDSIAFSAPFLDNTLQKMLRLQTRMLNTTADLSKAEGVEEKIIKEHAAQSAELSRIIALICAEKARQGA